MYEVLRDGKGWSVYWIEYLGAEPRLVPHVNKLGEITPYKHRQSAYRRKKGLNDAVKEIDKQIAKNGAIII